MSNASFSALRPATNDALSDPPRSHRPPRSGLGRSSLRSRAAAALCSSLLLCTAALSAQIATSRSADPGPVDEQRLPEERAVSEAEEPRIAVQPALGGSVTVKVFCDQGESIQDALQNPAVELRILVRGFCSESVEIRRDRVTLSGEDPALDGIDAPVDDDVRASALRIRAARHVRVENLTLRGASFEGLRILQSTDGITIANVALKGNGVRGGTVLDSIVAMEDVVVSGNGFGGDPAVGGWGGLLTSGSARLSCSGCSIQANPQLGENVGLRALRGSQVYLNDSIVEGQQAVRAHAASVFVLGGGLEAPYAAVLDDGSRVAFTELSFEGALNVWGNSTMTLSEAKQAAAVVDNFVSGNSTIVLETPRPDAPLPTFLVRPILLSGFARALVFENTEVPALQCSLGADAVCAQGSLVGASTCGQCPPP